MAICSRDKSSIDMKDNILNALKESLSGSDKLRTLLLDNVHTARSREIRLNLVYLTYDFSSQSILVEYYVEDSDYPAVSISFDELIHLVTT